MLSEVLDGLPEDFSQEEREFLVQGLSMYLRGWFPMYEAEVDGVEWVQGQRRAIVPLDERFVVSRSLRSKVRKGVFEVTSDTCFSGVIRACGEATVMRPETWLHEEIVELFELYRRAGLAHSVEAWVRDEAGERVLVGGLYGVAIGRMFCGESMFSRPELGGTDASKVCLVHLVGHLRRRGYAVLDAQLINEHMMQFGTYEIERREYLALMRTHSRERAEWGAFDAGASAGVVVG